MSTTLVLPTTHAAPTGRLAVADDLPHRPLRLHSTREMEPGQTVRFRALGAPRADAQEAVVLRSADRHLVLSVAGATPRGTQPYDEAAVDVRFTRFDDARYRFESRVVRTEDDREGIVCLAHSDRLRRRQARHYVRAPMARRVCFVPVTEVRLLARMLTARTAPWREQCMGRLLDLSGGGCCVRTDVAVPRADFLLLWFDFLAEDQFVEAPAQIVTVSDSVVDDVRRYRVHLRFRHVSEALRQSMIQYVFERQLHSPGQ